MLTSLWAALLLTTARAGSFDFYSGAGPTLGGVVTPLSIIQSISAERSFMKPDEEENNIFLRKRREDDPPNKWEPPSEPTAVSWNLGYTFSYSAVPETETTQGRVDNVHSVSGGLGWDPLEDFGASIGVRADTNPTENYRAGTITLGFGTVYYLEPPRRAQSDDADDDEVAPHLRHTEGFLAKGDISFRRPEGSDADDDETIEDPGPVVFARATLLFGKHIKHAVSGVRTPSGTITLPSQDIRQYGIGLEAWYYPETLTGYRANLTVYRYNASIDQFLASFRAQRNANPLAARAAGIGNFASLILGFPSISVDLGINKAFKEIWNFEGGVNLTTYEATVTKPTYSGSGAIHRQFGQDWRGGVGADLTIGTGFTSIMGSLLISRAI